MKKKICLILALLYTATLLFITGCDFSTLKVEEQAVVRLGLLSIEDNLPFYVAQEDGIFAQVDVEVELIPFNSARDRDIAIETGEIDGTLGDMLAVALLQKGGTPVNIVSLGLGATPQEGRFAILSAPSSPITTLSLLKGVPLAVSENTIIHYLAEELLEEKGFKREEIILQNIPDIKIRLDSLLARSGVEAALLPDPLATLAQTEGAHLLLDDSLLQTNFSQTVIFFREDVLKKEPEQIKKILSCYEKGAQSLNQSPEKYRELIIDKARIPKSLENLYSLPKYSPLQLPTPAMIKRVMDWMTDKGFLTHPYSYEEIVTPGLIPTKP